MTGLLTAALAETAIVAWRDLTKEHVPPYPGDFVSVAIIYGTLSMLPASASTFTSLVGWGFVIATLLNAWSPATPTKFAVPGGTATVQQGQPIQIQKAAPA